MLVYIQTCIYYLYVFVPTGAFVCPRSHNPLHSYHKKHYFTTSKTGQSKLMICSHVDQMNPNFTAVWCQAKIKSCLEVPDIKAVQATSWWNHPVHSSRTTVWGLVVPLQLKTRLGFSVLGIGLGFHVCNTPFKER